MSKKSYFVISLFLLVGLTGTALAEPIDVNNFSFEYDVNGEYIKSEEPATDTNEILGWTLRDTTGWAAGWNWVGIDATNWGVDNFEAADGNACVFSITWHDPNDANEFCELYQILEDSDAIIAENRRYTLTFNALRCSDIYTPDAYGAIFYSAGGTEGEGNDIILASEAKTLTWPMWDEPGYQGWEQVKVSYTALSGADSIGERLGVKLAIPLPHLEGTWAVTDNVRVEWVWATDAWEPSPPDGAKDVPKDATLTWRPGLWVQSNDGHEVYFGTSFNDVNNATTDTSGVFQGEQDANSWSVLDYDANGLVLGGTYYWRIDEVNTAYSGTTPPPPPDSRWKGQVWSFRVTGYATNPKPADWALNVFMDADLSWTPGTDSNSHDVYLGKSQAAVESAGTGDPEFKGNYDYDVNTYEPGLFLLDTTYFWRIDEVNLNSGTHLKGDIWRFKTSDYINLDDFDNYPQTEDLLDVWLDWDYDYDTKGEVYIYNGADANLVRDGNSMRFYYDNDASGGDRRKFSEIQGFPTGFEAGTDWLVYDSKALTLYFKGHEDNSKQPLYFVVKDGDENEAMVTYDDANGTQEQYWHEWNIDLQDFNGADVDLTDVDRVYLGIGVRDAVIPTGETGGGSGDVYFEDFRLYQYRCFPDLVTLAGDFDGDCGVGASDLAIMARDWLLGDYAAVPSIPQVEPIIWYMFDANTGTELGALVENSGTYGDDYDIQMGYFTDEDGDEYTDEYRIPSWTIDVAPPPDACDPNYALDFSGATDDTGDFLDFPALVDFNSNTVTITAWIKPGEGIQGNGDPESGYSGYTGLINCQAPNTVKAGLHYGGEWGGNWAWNGQLAYTWNDDDEYTWGFYSDLLIPELEWSFIAVAIEPTKATLCLSDGISINFSENVLEHEPEQFDGRTRIGSDPGSEDYRCFRGLMDDVRIYDVTLTQTELMGLADASYVPLASPANLYDEEPMFDKHVNLRDFAIFADNWLVQQLWP